MFHGRYGRIGGFKTNQRGNWGETKQLGYQNNLDTNANRVHERDQRETREKLGFRSRENLV